MTKVLALSDSRSIDPRPARWPIQALTPSGRMSGDDARRERSVVHVVDFDDELRSILANLFASVGLETRSYRDFGDFEQAARPDVPACLVVDAGLAAARGAGLQAQLQPLGGRVPVVVTASRPDVPMAVDAMKAGAVDFLPKPFREQDILQAVGAALAADRDRRQSRSRHAELRARFETLSRREREVMALVTAGRLNKQVAGDLGLCEITVKVHRGSAMRKMGARTLVDLVRMADALGLGAASQALRSRS